jgi:predicted tellurium resistance membrane protein TerC
MMPIIEPEFLGALILLTTLEVFLGVDNLIFITKMSEGLPASRRSLARIAGQILGLLSRCAILLGLVSFMRLSKAICVVFGHAISSRELVLIIGGLFLIAKSLSEMRVHLKDEEEEHSKPVHASLAATLAQIVILDVVFSTDSIVAAVAMANDLNVMIGAMLRLL